MQSINGPLLVFLSVALTIVSVATVCLARHRVWQASGAAGPDPRDPPELDDYELAYLNGGAALAATAAAVVLLRAGHLAGTEPAERHLSQEVQLRPGTPQRPRTRSSRRCTSWSPPCRRACAGSGWLSPSVR